MCPCTPRLPLRPNPLPVGICRRHLWSSIDKDLGWIEVRTCRIRVEGTVVAISATIVPDWGIDLHFSTEDADGFGTRQYHTWKHPVKATREIFSKIETLYLELHEEFPESRLLITPAHERLIILYEQRARRSGFSTSRFKDVDGSILLEISL